MSRIAGAGEPPQKPNVVFVFADQWRAQAAGYAGDTNVRTPAIDRLAAQAVRFTTAVSTCPVCSPYRASLLTGRYPLTHGVFLNDVCLSNEAVSMAQAFKQGGYRTAYIGKWHLDGHGRSSFIPPERRQGFEFWRTLECTHDYNNSCYYADENVKLKWDGYDAIAQTREAQGYIRSQAGKGPFLLVLSWGPPHNPYQTAPAQYAQKYKPDALVLRPNVPAAAAAAARKDLAGYYAHCEALDDCLGALCSTLRECGIEDDTILVFTSDHGDMLGSHGEARKQRPYDESIRVPLLVRWPRLGKDRSIAAPIGTPDLMPTLLGLCGLEVPKTVEGADFSGHIRGGPAPGDAAAIIACYAPFGEWTRARGGREYRGIRTARHTCVRSLSGPWLLFDNEADPYQQKNLCGEPQHAALQKEMDALLQKKLRETRDEFQPADYYIAKWKHMTDKSGTAPYAP
ncbi:MAG: sulfatase [Planctomycetes bacterium]|nr:sulfatase [Planctomycetota bacterium]